MQYSVWTVVARGEVMAYDEHLAAQDLKRWIEGSALLGVQVRGMYDVSGMREEADLLLWLHGPSAEGIQAALRSFRRTGAGEATETVWSAMGVVRDSEVGRGHQPAFLDGPPAQSWVGVSPVLPTPEWQELSDRDRRAALAERARVIADVAGVQVSLVPSLGLTDYEWIQAVEAPRAADLVEVARGLRAVSATTHLRDEPPFYAGRRIDHMEAVDVLR